MVLVKTAPGDQARALAERRERYAIGADIADIVGAHREEFSVLAQRELDLGDEIAPLIVGQESLRPGGGEFHRHADFLRRPEHEPKLDIHTVACAEIAADVERQNAQF
jgi:hypothetical protein